MRKVIIGMAIAVLAASAQASYLYWQVNLGNLSTSDGGSTYTFNGHNVADFTIGIKDNTGATVAHATSYGYYSSVSDAYVTFTPSTSASVANVKGNTYLVATIDSQYAQSNSSYSYYIEINGYDSVYKNETNYGMIGQSESLSYADAVSMGRISSDLHSMAAAAQAWTGGAYAAPEPTSGLLLLVGGALLALRRRRA